MIELSDRDWERINAFHDGELDDAETCEMAARIKAEPALAEALREVRSVSASLGALRPALDGFASGEQTRRANDNWRPFRWLAGGAVAAVIAIAVVLGPKLGSEPTAFEIHAKFAGEPFAIETSDLLPAAAVRAADGPDLSAAALTPVSLKTWVGGRAVHYAGRNGCRLTYFHGEFRLDVDGSGAGGQVASWTTTDNVRHAIVATGMDQSKFDAIANYLKLLTRQQASEQMMAALADTTVSAERCLG